MRLWPALVTTSHAFCSQVGTAHSPTLAGFPSSRLLATARSVGPEATRLRWAVRTPFCGCVCPAVRVRARRLAVRSHPPRWHSELHDRVEGCGGNRCSGWWTGTPSRRGCHYPQGFCAPQGAACHADVRGEGASPCCPPPHSSPTVTRTPLDMAWARPPRCACDWCRRGVLLPNPVQRRRTPWRACNWTQQWKRGAAQPLPPSTCRRLCSRAQAR